MDLWIYRTYDGSRFLVLLGPEKYNAIYNRIRHLVSLNIRNTYSFSHYFAKIKTDSYDSLPIKKY